MWTMQLIIDNIVPAVSAVGHNLKENKMSKTNCGFDFEPESKTEEYLVELNRIKGLIADLNVAKEKMTKLILKELNLAIFDDNGDVIAVAHDGQQSFVTGKFKVVVKTPAYWKIDKNEYQIVASSLRKEFDPVKTSVSYRIDKNIVDNIQTYGSKEDMEKFLAFASFDYSTFSVSATPNG